MQPDEKYLRWLGGFFDGEGSVSLTHSPNGQKNGNRTFRVMVTLSQKDPWALEEAHSYFGGRIVKNKSGCSQLVLQSKQAGDFLNAIAPYVRLKAMQLYYARCARFAQENYLLHGPTRQEASKILGDLRSKIQDLNRVT